MAKRWTTFRPPAMVRRAQFSAVGGGCDPDPERRSGGGRAIRDSGRIGVQVRRFRTDAGASHQRSPPSRARPGSARRIIDVGLNFELRLQVASFTIDALDQALAGELTAAVTLEAPLIDQLKVGGRRVRPKACASSLGTGLASDAPPRQSARRRSGIDRIGLSSAADGWAKSDLTPDYDHREEQAGCRQIQRLSARWPRAQSASD